MEPPQPTANPTSGTAERKSQAQFLTLLLQHEQNLRAFIGSLVRVRQDFDDILQDTVLTLWQKFGEFEPDRSFGAWARGVAAKKILQHRGRSGNLPTPFSPDAIQAVVDAFDRHALHSSDASDALETCLERLPAASRQALHLWYAEACSIDRIAAQLDCTVGAAYKMMARLRARLLECVRRRLTGIQEVQE